MDGNGDSLGGVIRCRLPAAQYAAENGIADIAVLYSVPNFITDKNLVFLAQ